MISGPGLETAMYFDDHFAYKHRLSCRAEGTLLSVSFTNLECRTMAAGGATSTPLLSTYISGISYYVASVQYLQCNAQCNRNIAPLLLKQRSDLVGVKYVNVDQRGTKR